MLPASKFRGTASALLVTAGLLATCVRADGDSVTWKQCAGQYNGTGVRELTRGSGDNEASDILLQSCNISLIHEGDLKGLGNLKVIKLWGNNIRHVDPIVFRSVPRVSHLDLEGNKIEAMPIFGEYSVLPNLKILDLSYNEITKLDNPKTFSSTKMLMRLVLAYNEIEYIHPDLFSGLSNLTKIDLDNNKLTYIPDRLFAISSLHRLYLANNSIEYVAPGAFDGSSLDKLYLEGNRLTHLPANFFTSVGASLKSFCLHHNPWQCEYLADIDIVHMKCVNQPSAAELQCSTSGAMRKFEHN